MQDEENACDGNDESLRQNIAPEYRHLITIKAGKPKVS